MASEPHELMRRAAALCLQLHTMHSEARIAAFRDALNTIQDSGRTMLRVLNGAALVNRLSDELLVRMLLFVPPLDWPSAGQVCHRWRFLVSKINQLRKDMELWDSDKGGFVRAAAMLKRFTNTPISLNLRLYTHGNALIELLWHHLSHIHRLSVTILSVAALDVDSLSCRTLVVALETPALILEDLDLWRVNGYWTVSEETYLSDELLAGLAPRLRSLSLHGLALHDRTYPALAGLRTLCLSQRVVDIAHIVASYPMLEELLIDTDSLIAGTTENLSPPRLELLQIPATIRAAEIVFDLMAVTRPLAVWTEARKDELFTYVLANLPREIARCIRFLFHVDFAQPACVVEYSSGITWVFELRPGIQPLALCDVALMASVTELTIHEIIWPRQPLDLPAAQNVTILEVVLHRPTLPYPGPEGPGTAVGMFLDDDESLCLLHCPAIETLSFLSPTQPALVVDVFDIMDVIERRLRFSAERLPCLRLRNVSLCDPAHGRGMELLTARVLQVEYCDFKPRDVPFIHQKHDSMSWIYGMLQ